MSMECNYIRKKWDKETMLKMLDRLRSTLPEGCVDDELRHAFSITDSEIDALYIAYYNLKDSFCPLSRRSFGKPKRVFYMPKSLYGDATLYGSWYTISPSAYNTYITTTTTDTTTASTFTTSGNYTTATISNDYWDAIIYNDNWDTMTVTDGRY